MKITKRTKLGLKVLIEIGIFSNKTKRMRGKQIAISLGISEANLDQIMMTLRSEKLVSTIRGRNGGYKLAKDANQISLLDVIKAFEGEIAFGKLEEGSITNINGKYCSEIWSGLSISIEAYASSIPLSRIIEKVKDQFSDFTI